MINLKEYSVNGYLVIPGFFTDEELDAILDDVIRVFSIGMFGASYPNSITDGNLEKFEESLFEFFEKDADKFINLGKQTQHLISLWRLAANKKIEKLLLDLKLDFPNFSVRPSVFFNSKFLDKVGHYWKLGDHQDWRSSQGSLDSVTIWYPYVDCSVELGALEVIPGSHLEGLLDCSDVNYYSKIHENLIDESKYIPVVMKKGDLLIFNSFLVHRSGTNSTRRIRWSSQLRYNNILDPSFSDRRFPNPYTYKPFEKLVEPGPPTKHDLMKYFANLESFK